MISSVTHVITKKLGLFGTENADNLSILSDWLCIINNVIFYLNPEVH